MTPFLILLLNLCATCAMWFELRRALAMSWQTSVAYGLGLLGWWLTAVLPAADVGAFLERSAQ
jgi:hypothetical protein